MKKHRKENISKYTVIKVTIMLIGGLEMQGDVNILNFQRFSDYIEEDNFKYIRLYNARSQKKSIETTGQRFLLIPKDQILFFEPFDQQKITGKNPNIK